ncbi:MAG: hypothetical protein GY949_15620 [Gammaproteobacteria bacterium]|nr:hypothetical protein [Gammaproteobacteria bacterium]
MQNQETSKQDQALQALLKDYVVPDAPEAFYEQALARATHEGTRRQKRRWLMTGFGSAVAAGLVLWLVSGLFLTTPPSPTANPDIPGITMMLEEPRTVNLVFASSRALDSAMLTVMLPDGIELAGFPGQREITWQTSLVEGKNLLPLELVAVSSIGGEVLARLEHDNRERTFHLRIEVS